MYQIGDTVMHPSEGVCSIEDIRPIRFSGNTSRDYYVLRPSMERGSGTVYLPVTELEAEEIYASFMPEQDNDLAR